MQSVYFDVPRWSGIAAAVVATSAMLVTIAFALRTGDIETAHVSLELQ